MALVRISAVVDERGRPVMIVHRCPVFENEFCTSTMLYTSLKTGTAMGVTYSRLSSLELLLMDLSGLCTLDSLVVYIAVN